MPVLQAEGQEGDMDKHLDLIMEIPVTLSMEVGRTNIAIRNLLKLNN